MILFERGEFMLNFDLKSGYHHVDIAVKHRKYLGFESEQCFYYVFKVDTVIVEYKIFSLLVNV